MDLEGRIEKLHSQLDDMSVRITGLEMRWVELDKRTAISEVILQRVEDAFNKNVDVLSRTTEAINSIEKTMISLQDQINMNAQVTLAIRDKVESIEAKFEESEEKAKIDFREVVKEFFKSKLVWFIGGGFTFVEVLKFLIENSGKIQDILSK